VRNLTNAAGVVTLSQSYAPYGEVLTTTGTGETAYAYTGEMYDARTGLVFLRARYYSVGDGRFLNRDQWDGDTRMPMSYNSWLYVYANPTLFTDPSGKCIDVDLDGKCDFESRESTTKIMGVTFSPNNWLVTEKQIIYNAIHRIGRRFAAIINYEIMQEYKFNCHEFEYFIGRPYTPVEAFSMVFRKLDFRKTNQTCDECNISLMNTNIGYYKNQGKSEEWIDNYIVENFDDVENWNCWGQATSSKSINIYKEADFSSINAEKWIIHEIGHVLDQIIDNQGEYAITNSPRRSELNKRGLESGFAQGMGMQQSSSTTDNEIFADMFLGWMYHTWETELDYPNIWTTMGVFRNNFMEDRMSNWVFFSAFR
jgi:RHS repeat-associated protein